MKRIIVLFIGIIIIVINSKFLQADDFNFKIIDSPLGTQNQIGVVKTLFGSNLLVTQLPFINDEYYKIYYSTNNGSSWSIHDTVARVSKKASFELYSEILYSAPLGTQISPYFMPTVGLHKTTDYGELWIPLEVFPDLTDENVNINIDSKGKIYLNEKGGLSISGDNDTIWKHNPMGTIKYVTINKQNDELYLSDAYSGLIKFTYGGIYTDYLIEKFNKPNLRFEIIRVTDKSELLGYSIVTSEPKGIYLSIDDTTWNLIKNVDTTTEINVIEPYKNLILIGTSTGLEYTSNSGYSWSKIELPDIQGNDKSITSISINDSGIIYAVYGNYYLIKGRLPYTDVEDENIIVNNSRLNCHIINNILYIKNINDFDIKLTVYNTLGQVIKFLNPYIEHNNNEYKMDVSDLNEGIYYILLKGNEKVFSKSFVILR